MLIFLGLLFLYVWCLKLFRCFFCRQTPCRLPTKKKIWISKGLPQAPLLSILSLKEHCFHQFESNLKTKHYKYALMFQGHFICSFVSKFFFLFYMLLFSEKTISFMFWKTMIIYTNSYLLHFYLFFNVFSFFYLFICVYCFLVSCVLCFFP